MKNSLATILLPQLDDLITVYDGMLMRTRQSDFSDISQSEATEFIAAGMAAIYRAVGSDNPYFSQTKEVTDKLNNYYPQLRIPHVGGAVKALRTAIASGYLISVEELIHADVFADFLEMAQHLIEEGYKDPAAVLVGSVLEEHLRKLCLKNGILIETIDTRGTFPRKADALNADLAKSNIYSKLDLKSVTSWLDLRNEAAHGKYGEYTQQQVEILLTSVRDSISRNPA